MTKQQLIFILLCLCIASSMALIRMYFKRRRYDLLINTLKQKDGEALFGYIRVHKPEMKVKDFEIYNAVYCGLCRKMGKTYGMLSKFSLSYDMAFVSLLESALSDEFHGFEQKKCRVNPLKTCTYCKRDSESQELASAAGVALTDMKVLDNICDSTFFKSLFYRFLRLFTKQWSKKAYKKYRNQNKNRANNKADQNILNNCPFCRRID